VHADQASVASAPPRTTLIASEDTSLTHEESLKLFILELQRYDASFSASVDEFDDDEFVIGVDHRVNIAATQLANFYRSKKLPVAPRHAFRELLRLAGRQPTWESVETAIDELTTWAESELARLNNECPRTNEASVPTVERADGGNAPRQVFDVLLAHNSSDRNMVAKLKALIQACKHGDGRRLTAWLDKDELRPGVPRQKLIEAGIRHSKSTAVLVAADGLGPCEVEEMYSALELAFRDGRPVIPVLLPGAPKKPELPIFLNNRTWVDLRAGMEGEEFDKLIWGITGKKTDEPIPDDTTGVPTSKKNSEERCFPTIVTTQPAVSQYICVRGSEFFSVTWDSTNGLELNRQKVTSNFAARAMAEWQSYAPETYRELFPDLAGDQDAL
jgi:hypothetical protein